MRAIITARAFYLAWIPLTCLCSLAIAQVSELSETEQRERLKNAFFDCLRKMNSDPVTLTGLHCNRTWDNVMCWPDTPAGTVGYQSCPAYINRFDQAEYATKHCLENGTWYLMPESGKPWTNFSACIRKHNKETLPELIVEHMPGIKLMYTIGYSLSLAALILAVTIMVYFRRLHCQRNMIHLNMFMVFLMRAAFSLMKNALLVNDLGFPNDVNNTGHRIEFIREGTHWECKLFFTVFNYIIFASIMWLFNEGLYLVLILSVSVFSDKTKIRWFALIGWGTPVIFVIPWVVCRIKLDDMLCWNVHVRDKLYWILKGPMVASVAVNFVFFIILVRMLFTKLTASNCPDSKKVRYRKLAKSTLILIPLFAVYYMGFIWLPDGLSPASDLFKIYVEMLFNSFQGFLVALLFCFLNAEVQNEIRKKWQRHAVHRSGSWRSQPSFASFLRRSGVHRDNHHSAAHHKSHSRSFLDSSVSQSPGSHSPATSAKAAANGHLAPICEEAVPLNSGGCQRETSVQMCIRQDYNDNRTNCVAGEDLAAAVWDCVGDDAAGDFDSASDFAASSLRGGDVMTAAAAADSDDAEVTSAGGDVRPVGGVVGCRDGVVGAATCGGGEVAVVCDGDFKSEEEGRV